MGKLIKNKHYREDLANRANLPNVKVRARIEHVQNEQVCLKDIELLDHYDYFGDKIDFKDHMWVPAKPFQEIIANGYDAKIIDFVGTVYRYSNKKGETNYSLKNIKHVRFLTEVMTEMFLIGAGMQPTKEAVDWLMQTRNSQQYQDRFDNIINQLSDDAKVLFLLIFRLAQFNFAFDAQNFYFQETYQTLINQLENCLEDNCDNDTYKTLVEISKYEYGMPYFSEKAINMLSNILGDKPSCIKKFAIIANELISVLKKFKDLAMFESHIPLPSRFSNQHDLNKNIASRLACNMCKNNRSCDGQCHYEKEKDVLSNYYNQKLDFIGGSVKSIKDRFCKMNGPKYVYSRSMHYELRGIVDHIENGKIHFEQLFLFIRLPNLPEYQGDHINEWSKIFMTEDSKMNISSDGYWEIIQEASEVDGFNEWGEEDLYNWFVNEIPDLKSGDVVRFRWNWHDYLFKSTLAFTQEEPTTEEEIDRIMNDVLKKQFETDENGKLVNKIYNVEKIPSLVF